MKNNLALSYKTFLKIIHHFEQKARLFFYGIHFQHSLMFVGKAWSLPLYGRAGRVCFGLTLKYQTWIRVSDITKRSSFLIKMSV